MGTTRMLSMQIVGVHAVPVAPPPYTKIVNPVISVAESALIAVPDEPKRNSDNGMVTVVQPSVV